MPPSPTHREAEPPGSLRPPTTFGPLPPEPNAGGDHPATTPVDAKSPIRDVPLRGGIRSRRTERTTAGRLTAPARARATLALGAALPVRLALAQERFDALA